MVATISRLGHNVLLVASAIVTLATLYSIS